MKNWQEVLLRTAGVAAGVAVALAALALSIYWYSARPKAWDTHALIVKHAIAEGLSHLNDKFEEVSSGLPSLWTWKIRPQLISLFLKL